MNNKNISRHQHVVQKWLLSNFTSTPQNIYEKQRIWQFDKETQQSIEVSLKKAGTEKDFLTPEADRMITILEKECCQNLDRIIENECMVRKGASEVEKNEMWIFEWFSIYRYISVQLQRTNLYRDEITKRLFLSEQTLKSFHSFSFKPFRTPYFIDIGGRAKIEYLSSRGYNFNRGELAKMFYFLIPLLSSVPSMLADCVACSIIDMSLPFIIINESSVPYIQNDIGLAPFYPFDTSTFTPMTLFADNAFLTSILAFPLTPRLCVHLCTTDSGSKWAKNVPKNSGRGLLLSAPSEQDAKPINGQMFAFAKRFVYSQEKLNINTFRQFTMTNGISEAFDASI